MSPELKQVISSSFFTVHDGTYVYAKVSGQPSLDNCFMLSKDANEITAVFEASKSDKFKIIEKNKDLRKLIEIQVSTPFYALGFLAAVTKAISEKGCNNLIISTYSKDYILVTEAHFSAAKQALIELGFREQ
jgi:hypothetical protein